MTSSKRLEFIVIRTFGQRSILAIHDSPKIAAIFHHVLTISILRKIIRVRLFQLNFPGCSWYGFYRRFLITEIDHHCCDDYHCYDCRRRLLLLVDQPLLALRRVSCLVLACSCCFVRLWFSIFLRAKLINKGFENYFTHGSRRRRQICECIGTKTKHNTQQRQPFKFTGN